MATFEGTYTQKPGDTDPSLAPVADHMPVRDPARLAQQLDGRQRRQARDLPRILAAHDAVLRPAARRRRAARRRHRQPRRLHAASRARALRAGGHSARRGDPHRDGERRALRGRARRPRHDRARQARRPDPGGRRPDAEHLRHPQGQLRAAGRRRLLAGGDLRGIRDPAVRATRRRSPTDLASGGRRQRPRPADRVALHEVDAHRARGLERGDVLDLLRDQAEVQACAPCRRPRSPSPG